MFDPIKSLEKHLGEVDFNSRIPFYNDDSDYTTNAPSYYDDLARKNKLIKHLALRIWDYDKELDKRFKAWDKNLEEFDDEVLRLLKEWMEDGTFDTIINEVIFNDLNNKINHFEGGFVTVLYYGAVGDGVTDDTQAFKDALSGGNKTVIIPEGYEYKISGNLNVESNTTIFGGGLITIDDDFMGSLFQSENSENIDISVNASGDGGKSTYILDKYLIYFNNCKNVKVSNNILKHFDGSYCILLRNCENFEANKNTIHDYSYAGIALLDGCTNGDISNNHVTENSNREDFNSYPIMLSGYDAQSPVNAPYAENITCDGNYIYNTTSWWEGIDAHGGKSLKVTNNTVIGCMIGIALITAGERGLYDSSIIGNTCIGNNQGITRSTSNVGITLSAGDGDGNVVSNNTIKSFGYLTDTEDLGGIKFQSSDNSSVTNNKIEDCFNNGITINFGGTGINIQGNTITNLKSHRQDNTIRGISISNPTSNYVVDITGNTFMGNGDENSVFINGPTNSDDSLFNYIKEFNNNIIDSLRSSRTRYVLLEVMTNNPQNTSTIVGLKDDFVRNSDYSPGKPLGWLCVKSGDEHGRSEWLEVGGVLNVHSGTRPENPELGTMIYDREIQKPLWYAGSTTGWIEATETRFFFGITDNRPSNPEFGMMYLDTFLGKPIWYSSGQTWVDANGDEV